MGSRGRHSQSSDMHNFSKSNCAHAAVTVLERCDDLIMEFYEREVVSAGEAAAE